MLCDLYYCYMLYMQATPLLLKSDKWSTVQKMNIYSRYKLLRNIETKLSSKYLTKFKASPFEKLLDLKITKFSRQLLYHNVRRQCSLTKEDELWFHFKEKLVQLGLRDFEKVMGLNCRNLLEDHLCLTFLIQ